MKSVLTVLRDFTIPVVVPIVVILMSGSHGMAADAAVVLVHNTSDIRIDVFRFENNRETREYSLAPLEGVGIETSTGKIWIVRGADTRGLLRRIVANKPFEVIRIQSGVPEGTESGPVVPRPPGPVMESGEGSSAGQLNFRNTVLTDLHKAAGKGRTFRGNPDERRLQPVAPLAPKPNGGAYVQWATAEGWNEGLNEGEKIVTSTVYVTEIDNQGRQVTPDIMLGKGEPAGIVATDDGFSYHLKDQNRLVLGRYRGSRKFDEVVLMDHGPRPTTFRRGIDLRTDNNGDFPFGWAVPYNPFNRGHGGLVYANGTISSIFSTWNNYQPSGHPRPGGWSNPNDGHTGSTAWFFGERPSQQYRMSYATGDHSLDQRMIADNGSFYSVSLNPHLVFQRFDSTGTRQKRTVLFDRRVDYTTVNGVAIEDQGAMELRVGNGNWEPRTHFLEEKGYTLGRLGDLHAIGNGQFALTYGYAAWDGSSLGVRSKKNQVDIAILDQDGQVLNRKIVAKADPRSGTNGYTDYSPFERIAWVKSVSAGDRILVVWATEQPGRKYQSFSAVVSLQGDLLQEPSPISDQQARFSFNDRLHTLNNGTVAWTYTGSGSLQVYLLSP